MIFLQKEIITNDDLLHGEVAEINNGLSRD